MRLIGQFWWGLNIWFISSYQFYELFKYMRNKKYVMWICFTDFYVIVLLTRETILIKEKIYVVNIGMPRLPQKHLKSEVHLWSLNYTLKGICFLKSYCHVAESSHGVLGCLFFNISGVFNILAAFRRQIQLSGFFVVFAFF